MGSRAGFTGGRGGGYSWGMLFEGLRNGHVAAYLVLISLAAAATVAFWAGTNMRKKDTRR